MAHLTPDAFVHHRMVLAMVNALIQCPRCRTSKRHRIAYRLFNHLCGWTPGKRYVRRRVGCTRCRISWDVFHYARFNIVTVKKRP